MPTELIPKATEWSELTPIGVCLGLLCLIIIVGIPWALKQHRNDMTEARTAYLGTIEKQVKFSEDMSQRYEQERKRVADECAVERRQLQERYESSLREVVQAVQRRRT